MSFLRLWALGAVFFKCCCQSHERDPRAWQGLWQGVNPAQHQYGSSTERNYQCSFQKCEPLTNAFAHGSNTYQVRMVPRDCRRSVPAKAKNPVPLKAATLGAVFPSSVCKIQPATKVLAVVEEGQLIEPRQPRHENTHQLLTIPSMQIFILPR